MIVFIFLIMDRILRERCGRENINNFNNDINIIFDATNLVIKTSNDPDWLRYYFLPLINRLRCLFPTNENKDYLENLSDRLDKMMQNNKKRIQELIENKKNHTTEITHESDEEDESPRSRLNFSGGNKSKKEI